MQSTVALNENFLSLLIMLRRQVRKYPLSVTTLLARIALSLSSYLQFVSNFTEKFCVLNLPFQVLHSTGLQSI
jgi:hypothetical protein